MFAPAATGSGVSVLVIPRFTATGGAEAAAPESWQIGPALSLLAAALL
jgi:hypothetical protein